MVIESSRLGWSAYVIGLGIAMLCLGLYSYLTGAASIVVPFLAVALGVGVGGLTLALWWQRICFDGPRIWYGGFRRRWKGPIDLRSLAACSSYVRRRYMTVLLYMPDPLGRRVEFERLGFDEEAVQRLDRRGPFTVHSIRVGAPVSAAGLGEYVLRHIDPERCELGAAVLWRHVEKARQRRSGSS